MFVMGTTVDSENAAAHSFPAGHGLLHRSISVPDLNPSEIGSNDFPQQVSDELPPPIVDFADLGPATEAATTIGCFQLVNHEVTPELLCASRKTAAAVFKLPPEKKKKLRRPEEGKTGFEEAEEEIFWWCRRREEEEDRLDIVEFEDFRYKMEPLWLEMERISTNITKSLQQTQSSTMVAAAAGSIDTLVTPHSSDSSSKPGKNKSVLCLYRGEKSSVGSLHNDALRMMSRSSMCSFSLNLHVCAGEFAGWFQVYSRRGWLSFEPADGAIVVTIGSHLQKLSGGAFKQVVGRPVYSRKRRVHSNGFGKHEEEEEEFISSMGFVYCHSDGGSRRGGDSGGGRGGDGKTISLLQQLGFVVWVILLYNVWAHLMK